MIVKFDERGTIQGFQKILVEAAEDDAAKSLLIFAADANGFTSEELNPVLRKIKKPVFGGIFPGIIFGSQKFEKGTIIIGMRKTAQVQIISNLSDGNADYEKMIDEKVHELGAERSVFVFVDGFSKRISALITSLFDIFGLEINYIGGGAGSLSLEQKPCLLTNQGLIGDSAVLAFSECESGIGVSHGWKEIEGPYQVTESDRDVIKSLDGFPALDVYKKVVEANTGQVLNEANFFSIAKGFPLGISKLETEKVIRDPFKIVNGNQIKCIGEIQPGAFVSVMKGEVDSLVAAAKNALWIAQHDFRRETGGKVVLFMDCISRVLFLEDNFQQELNEVNQGNIPLIGALTIGEIANNGKDYLEFYNKTAVVGVLGD